MEKYFVIPDHLIENVWNPLERKLELFVLEYCEEILELPLYLVADARFSKEGLCIELQHLEAWMIGETWYVNLFGLSHFAEAS